MNILFLHAHDMGRYNSAYGHAAPTPNILNMAREGMLFRQAYCAGPTCPPSRAAMLTGETAHQAGVLGLINRGFDLGDRSKPLARHLSAHGYETILTGLQHECDERHSGDIYSRILKTDAPSPGTGPFET